jgi:hypothetical protein
MIILYKNPSSTYNVAGVYMCSFYLFAHAYFVIGARGSVVGWGTMLQVGSSPVRVPDEVDFLTDLIIPAALMALGSTQPLTEMSTRNLPGGKKRPARRADNFAAIYEPNVWKCASLNLSQPWGPPGYVTGIILKFYFVICAWLFSERINKYIYCDNETLESLCRQ